MAGRSQGHGCVRDISLRDALQCTPSLCIASLVAETDLGVHKINVCLLLYQSLFLSTMLFNSQTWSNLRKKDLEDLKTLQCKFLKKIIGVPNSTCNAFTFLELGVLPIEQEIHKRQLMYLQRILQLDEDDPVKKVFEFQCCQSQTDGERNWWSGIKELMEKYEIEESLEEIKNMSKEVFKNAVNLKVRMVALEELRTECQSKKKTSELEYTELKMQGYLQSFYPNQAKVVFKCRSKTLDIKAHLTYKYKDSLCRKCGGENENVQHVINCGHEETLRLDLTEDILADKANTIRCLRRIECFLEEVTSDESPKTSTD